MATVLGGIFVSDVLLSTGVHRMRIMHVLNHCHDGNGHVNVAVDLACTQVVEGHDVAIASSGGPYVDRLRSEGVLHADLPDANRHGGRLGGIERMMGSSGRLVSEVRRFRPDVLHAHMMSSALQGFVAGRLLRVPLVTTVHNSFDRHSFLMRVGRRVVAVSEAERRTLLARGYPAARLVTVLNGTIGSPRSDWAQDRIGELPQPSVMTLSGLPRKGLPDVIDAFARVLPDFPQWHLNIVGNGPDRDHLAELIRVRGLTASVHLQGSTWNPHPLLEQSAIFASGSLAEPFGLVLAEARAAGCAVVATDVGGVPEVLDHGRAGLLCPPSDPAAMSHHFRRLMGDPALLTEWQTRARVGVERFTVARMTADYQRVYEAVLPDRTPVATRKGSA